MHLHWIMHLHCFRALLFTIIIIFHRFPRFSSSIVSTRLMEHRLWNWNEKKTSKYYDCHENAQRDIRVIPSCGEGKARHASNFDRQTECKAAALLTNNMHKFAFCVKMCKSWMRSLRKMKPPRYSFNEVQHVRQHYALICIKAQRVV